MTRLSWPLTLVLRVGAFKDRPLSGGSQLHPEAQLAVSWTRVYSIQSSYPRPRPGLGVFRLGYSWQR